MDISSLVIFLLIGGLAGWLAGKFVRGQEFDLVRSIIVGVIGALFGGWLFGQLGINIGGGFIGDMVVAVIGACILLILVRWLSKVF